MTKTCETYHWEDCPAGKPGCDRPEVQCGRSGQLDHTMHVAACADGCDIIWHLDIDDPNDPGPATQHDLIALAASEGVRFDGTKVVSS